MALWGGRFTQAADQRFKQFNDSLRFENINACRQRWIGNG